MFAGIIQGLGTIEKFNSDEVFFRTSLDLQKQDLEPTYLMIIYQNQILLILKNPLN